ncbi:hypothetical protein B0H11DRAFT_2063065, partial [Mycena galericulata]
MAEPPERSALLGPPQRDDTRHNRMHRYCDLITLCQTNQWIYRLCLGRIYRSIHLDDPGRLLKFCQSVLGRKEAANAVREIETACFLRDAAAVANFNDTWKSAVGIMKNIRSFRIFSSAEIIPFLKQHPMLTCLRVAPWYQDGGEKDERDVASEFTSLIHPIHMPNLQQFSGPAMVINAVIPGSRPSSMGIHWENHNISGKTFSDILRALARTNVVEMLTNLLSAWENALLSAIVNHIPKVKRLRFQIMIEDNDSEAKALFFSSVESALPALPELEHLAILEKLTPSSDAILSRNTLWRRLRGVWFPKLENAADFHYSWFFKKVFTTPTLPPTYARMAQLLAGLDGMLTAKRAFETTGALPDFAVTLDGD